MAGEINTQLKESDWIEKTAVPNTSAYAAGDLIGNDLIAFVDYDARKTLSGHIKTVMAVDKAKQAADLNVYFLQQSTTASIFSNNEPLQIANDDARKVIGVARLTEHCQLGSASLSLWNGDITYRLRSGTSLYGFVEARGTPTYTSASDLLIRLGVAQD